MAENIADGEGTTREEAPAKPSPGGRRKPVLIGAVAVVVASITAAVTVIVSTGSDDSPAPRPKARPAPTVQPLRLSTEPLWTSPSGVEHAEALDGVVLMGSFLGLTLAEAETGRVRWTLEGRQALPGGDGAKRQETLGGGSGLRHLVRHGDGVGVLVEYRRWTHCTPDGQECFHGPGDEDGLALLSGVDGSVVWQTPIISPHPADTDVEQLPSQVLRAVDDRVALVSIAGLFPSGSGYDQGTSATIAIDVRTGQKLWERSDGMWPDEIVGDVALGQVSKNMPGDGLSPSMTNSTAMALELATGHPRWDLSDRYGASRLVSVAGGIGLVHGIPKNAPDKREFAIVDAMTGREVTKFPGTRFESCDTDGRSLITCLSREKSEFTLTSYDVENHAVRTTMTGRDAKARIMAVWANRVELMQFDREDPYSYTLDAFGNRIDTKSLPGQVATISKDRAILFVDNRSETSVAMYRVL